MSCSKDIRLVVFVLIIFLGVASWVDINGVWVELPILVQKLPEAWTLPSYLVVLTQAANIGPLLYFIFKMLCSKYRSEKAVIFTIICTNIITCLLIIFLWQQTTMIGGYPHSTAIFSLYFILALVDCTSNLVFYPFMGNFKPSYMSAYFIGEGFSGLFPGVLSLIQGSGRIHCVNVTVYNTVSLNGSTWEEVSYTMKASYGDNNFSFEVFYSLICVIIVISGISFSLLVFHPSFKKEQIGSADDPGQDDVAEKELMTKMKDVECEKTRTESDEMNPSDMPEDEQITNEDKDEDEDEGRTKEPVAKPRKLVWYIPIAFLTAWVNGLRNSVLLSVQSYSCLPYGITSFHLAVTLANVANPLACFFNLYFNVTSVPALSVLSVISTLLGTYIMVTAVMSPTPVLVGTLGGAILIVAVWAVCMFLFTYVKVCLASLFRTQGKKGLLYCGAATQVGSAVGGVVMFISVNVMNVFRSVDPCAQPP